MGRASWASGLLLWALSFLAWAAEADPRFDIPDGSLADGLGQLASQAHLQLLYDPGLVQGRTAPALHGQMTRSQALQHLLPADIAFRFTGEDSVALFHRSLPAPVGSSSSPLAETPRDLPLQAVTVTAQKIGESELTKSRLIYATGPSLDVPASNASIGQSLMQERQTERVEDILESVSDVVAAPEGLPTYGFEIRGVATYQYYVDGVRVSPDLDHDDYRDLANIENIEVIKGPASTLYGRTEPGGLVNFVTKQAPVTPEYSIEQQFSSDGGRRTQLDLGGPLTSDASLRYRVDAAIENDNSYRDALSSHRVFVAPTLTWNSSDQTETTFYLEYLNSSSELDTGIPVVGSVIPSVPAGRRVEEGGNIQTRDLRGGVRGTHDFNPHWNLKYHLDARHVETPQGPQLALGDDGLDPGSCSRQSCPVDQYLFAVPQSSGKTYYGSVELEGSWNLGMLSNTLRLGAEYFDVKSFNNTIFSDLTYTTDLYSPVVVPVPKSIPADGNSASFITIATEHWGSAYIQDQIGISNNIVVLAGARFDGASEQLNDQKRWDHSVKPRVSLIWNPLPALGFYASYVQNFGIAVGIYGNGEEPAGTLVPPELAHEFEVGSKLNLFGGRLTGTLSWFDLTQSNISLPSFNALEFVQGVRAVTGAVHNEGTELDLQAQLSPKLRLIASYAYLDSLIIHDVGFNIDADGNPVTTSGNTGNRFFGVPRQGGSFWLTYGDEATPGFTAGIGALARTWAAGDNENDYRLPGFTRANVMIGYSFNLPSARLVLRCNIDNVLNKRYFESVSDSQTVMPGWPRRVLASVRMDF